MLWENLRHWPFKRRKVGSLIDGLWTSRSVGEGWLVTRGWLHTCIQSSLNACEIVADPEPGTCGACAGAHNALDLLKEVALWPLGVTGFLRVPSFLTLSHFSVQETSQIWARSVPASFSPRSPESSPFHSVTWDPTSFHRHSWSHFVINIYLIELSQFLPQEKMQVHSLHLICLCCLFHCVNMCYFIYFKKQAFRRGFGLTHLYGR